MRYSLLVIAALALFATLAQASVDKKVCHTSATHTALGWPSASSGYTGCRNIRVWYTDNSCLTNSAGTLQLGAVVANPSADCPTLSMCVAAAKTDYNKYRFSGVSAMPAGPENYFRWGVTNEGTGFYVQCDTASGSLNICSTINSHTTESGITNSLDTVAVSNGAIIGKTDYPSHTAAIYNNLFYYKFA